MDSGLASSFELLRQRILRTEETIHHCPTRRIFEFLAEMRIVAETAEDGAVLKTAIAKCRIARVVGGSVSIVNIGRKTFVASNMPGARYLVAIQHRRLPAGFDVQASVT